MFTTNKSISLSGNFSQVTRRSVVFITPNTSTPPNDQASCLCKQFLEDDLYETGVKYWDIALLCPQVVLFIFLVLKLRSSIANLRRSRSPLFTLMYVLVWTDTIVALIRATAAVAMRSLVERGDQILWLILNFFFVATEIAVLAFAVLFGHLDSGKGVRRVVLSALGVASLSTVIMTTLEFQTEIAYPMSFHHGTMPFLAASTAVFLLVYSFTLALPCSPWRDRFLLPSKRSFYVYCAAFVVLDLLQLIGCALVLGNVYAGYCLLDITIFTYMTFLPMAVYFVFLRVFFARPQLGIPFSFDDPGSVVAEHSDGTPSLPSTPYAFSRNLTIQFDNDNSFTGDVTFVQPNLASTKPLTMPHSGHTLPETTFPSMSL